MRSTTKALALLLALPIALTACEQDKKKAEQAASTACGSQFSGTPSKPLPSDVPGPSDQAVYDYLSQGKTEQWLATTSGTREDIVKTRDAIADQLKSAGYQIEGSDQEKGIEAEAEFTGPHKGTIQVSVACEGKLRVRYRLES